MSAVRIMLVAFNHARVREVENLRNIFVGHGFEQRHPHHMKSDDNARDEGNQRNGHHQAFDVAFAHLVHKGLFLVLEKTHHGVGRQRDEHRVDEEEVKRADEKLYLPGSQAESRRAEGRNPRRGNRHARDNGRSPILARLCHDSCQTAEHGNQHVVGRRYGAGQQLAAVRRKGRHEEIDRRSDDCHNEHQRVVAQRLFQQFEIVDAQRKPDTHNRPHNRGNKHGPDNHGGRIDV